MRFSVIPANPGSGPGQAPESRDPAENRHPVFDMVPDFRRDDVWTPAFAGVTIQEAFCLTIKVAVSCPESLAISYELSAISYRYFGLLS
jgi:hypothetical protein